MGHGQMGEVSRSAEVLGISFMSNASQRSAETFSEPLSLCLLPPPHVHKLQPEKNWEHSGQERIRKSTSFFPNSDDFP